MSLNAYFQRTNFTMGKIAPILKAAPDLFKHGDGADTGRRLQDRHNLGIPDLGKRIGAAGPAAGLFDHTKKPRPVSRAGRCRLGFIGPACGSR